MLWVVLYLVLVSACMLFFAGADVGDDDEGET